jgi:predicted anti-sigma-YlaC factor YlaD
MNAHRCPREDELLDACGRGFIGAELAAHVEECSSCHEIHLVVGALLDERVQAITEAPVPSAGTMRWRMQIRHQQEAQATARRSLLVGQAMTLAVAIALLVWLFGPDVRVGVREVIASIRLSTPLLVALATWLIFGPIAGYVAIRQK